ERRAAHELALQRRRVAEPGELRDEALADAGVGGAAVRMGRALAEHTTQRARGARCRKRGVGSGDGGGGGRPVAQRAREYGEGNDTQRRQEALHLGQLTVTLVS